MKKKVFWFTAPALLLLVGIGLALLWQNWQRNRLLKEKLEETIGRDAGSAEVVLKFEAEAKTATIDEAFRLFDKAIDDRTALIAELRGLYPDLANDFKAELIEYLIRENELVRSKRLMYQKMLGVSMATKVVEAQLRIMEQFAQFGIGTQTLIEEVEELKKRASELQGYAEGFWQRYEEVCRYEGRMESRAASLDIRFVSVARKFRNGNRKIKDDATRTAEGMLRLKSPKAG